LYEVIKSVELFTPFPTYVMDLNEIFSTVLNNPLKSAWTGCAQGFILSFQKRLSKEEIKIGVQFYTPIARERFNQHLRAVIKSITDGRKGLLTYLIKLVAASYKLVLLYDSLSWITRHLGISLSYECLPVKDKFLNGKHILPSIIDYDGLEALYVDRFHKSLYIDRDVEVINLVSDVDVVSDVIDLVSSPLTVSSSKMGRRITFGEISSSEDEMIRPKRRKERAFKFV
jgi:hypothetical protein